MVWPGLTTVPFAGDVIWRVGCANSALAKRQTASSCGKTRASRSVEAGGSLVISVLLFPLGKRIKARFYRLIQKHKHRRRNPRLRITVEFSRTGETQGFDAFRVNHTEPCEGGLHGIPLAGAGDDPVAIGDIEETLPFNC